MSQENMKLPLYPEGVNVWQNEKTPAFTLETGTILMKQSIKSTETPPTLGTKYSRSLTLAELTERIVKLEEQAQSQKRKNSRNQELLMKLEPIPVNFAKFQVTQEEAIKKLIADVNRAINSVYSQLDSLLEGKAKPNEESVNLVMQLLKTHGEKISKIENYLKRK